MSNPWWLFNSEGDTSRREVSLVKSHVIVRKDVVFGCSVEEKRRGGWGLSMLITKGVAQRSEQECGVKGGRYRREREEEKNIVIKLSSWPFDSCLFFRWSLAVRRSVRGFISQT